MTALEDPPGTWVGQALKRKEDPRLITGRAPLRRRHQRHRAALGLVRPLARGAREDRLDRHVAAQWRVPACTPCYTGADLDLAAPLPMAWVPPGIEVQQPAALAAGQGRGQPRGRSRGRGHRRGPLRRGRRRRAGDRRVRPAPGGDRRRGRARRTAPLVHDDLGTNKCHEWSLGGGDIDAALRARPTWWSSAGSSTTAPRARRSSRAACSPTTAPAR